MLGGVMQDPFDLDRFVQAQAPVMDRVLEELRQGRKATHWIWFVFPQIHGLGRSAMAERFAISSLAEAKAYLGHPVLGPRLVECTRLMNVQAGRSAFDILGPPDDLKFHASMTLFAKAADKGWDFQRALDRFFDGQRHAATIEQLRSDGP
ncbi:MAG TPA: DUF1810 domain-containing protein [Caulobacteraceae bacterium]|jgi:uncharacterized protein (DUF1810 family)|nr:DUF1810 domain-containing protein [Caulobacteraceae bacterium]